MPARSWFTPASIGLLAGLLLAWAAMPDWTFTDYDSEAAPAFDALRSGDLGGFFGLLPLYGGSLVLRAPFVALSDALGGGALAAFRAAALPCVLAAVALGAWLSALVKGPARWAVLALATCSPVIYVALEFGHPEELLGAVLCVTAVLCAMHDRPAWAAVALGLALGNKAWAVIAIGPVLLALDRDRVKVGAAAIGIGALLSLPLLIGGHDTIAQAGSGAATAVFKPAQVWWFFGAPGDFTGVKAGHRVAPGWVVEVARPLLLLLWIPVTLAFARRGAARADALGLLALLFALRCALDFWNTTYYALPLLFALLAWEATRGRAPVLTALVTAAVWLTFELAPGHISADAQTAIYLAWMLPLIAGLAFDLLHGAPDHRRPAGTLRHPAGVAQSVRAAES